VRLAAIDGFSRILKEECAEFFGRREALSRSNLGRRHEYGALIDDLLKPRLGLPEGNDAEDKPSVDQLAGRLWLIYRRTLMDATLMEDPHVEPRGL